MLRAGARVRRRSRRGRRRHGAIRTTRAPGAAAPREREAAGRGGDIRITVGGVPTTTTTTTTPKDDTSGTKWYDYRQLVIPGLALSNNKQMTNNNKSVNYMHAIESVA